MNQGFAISDAYSQTALWGVPLRALVFHVVEGSDFTYELNLLGRHLLTPYILSPERPHFIAAHFHGDLPHGNRWLLEERKKQRKGRRIISQMMERWEILIMRCGEIQLTGTLAMLTESQF